MIKTILFKYFYFNLSIIEFYFIFNIIGQLLLTFLAKAYQNP